MFCEIFQFFRPTEGVLAFSSAAKRRLSAIFVYIFVSCIPNKFSCFDPGCGQSVHYLVQGHLFDFKFSGFINHKNNVFTETIITIINIKI